MGCIIMAEISGCLEPASVLPGYGGSSSALPPPISGLFVLMLCDMAHCFVHLWLRVNGQRVYEGSGQEKKRGKGAKGINGESSEGGGRDKLQAKKKTNEEDGHEK